MFSKWNIKSTCVYMTAPCIMTLTFISTCVYKPLCLNNSCSYQNKVLHIHKGKFRVSACARILKWDIYVLVFINLINTTLVSNHWGWYLYQIFTCKYLVLEVSFLLCQILDGDSLVVYQFYLLSALNNLKKKCKRKGFLLV